MVKLVSLLSTGPLVSYCLFIVDLMLYCMILINSCVMLCYVECISGVSQPYSNQFFNTHLTQHFTNIKRTRTVKTFNRTEPKPKLGLNSHL